MMLLNVVALLDLLVLEHPAEVRMRIMVIDRRVVNCAVGNTVGYAIVGAA